MLSACGLWPGIGRVGAFCDRFALLAGRCTVDYLRINLTNKAIDKPSARGPAAAAAILTPEPGPVNIQKGRQASSGFKYTYRQLDCVLAPNWPCDYPPA
jgi:hypothetical protein